MNKLRQRTNTLKVQLKKLRLDNKQKCSELNSIKNLNIKLQLDVKKCRMSDKSTPLQDTQADSRVVFVLRVN